MDPIWRVLIEHWRTSVTHPVERGVDATEISRREFELSVRLPNDLRGYFGAVNGTGAAMDCDLYRFWPLEEFRRVKDVLDDVHSDRHAYPNYFVFADYCISCWLYAVEIVDGSDVSGRVFRLTGGGDDEQVADGFLDFVRQYLRNPKQLL